MKVGSIIRVLVADDSALMRNLISRLLGRAPDILVAATARDGEDAVQKAIQLKPDVVTMDINMPKLDGISAMQMILAEKICPVIMLSSLTQQGAVETFECLELGAFDFVAKPEGTVSAKLDSIAEELITKVRAAAASGGLRRPRPKPAASPPARPLARPAVRPANLPLSEMRAVAIGISTGGPATISTFLPGLPADLPAAIFLVQHMPAAFISTYVSRLQKECAIEVVEAETGASVHAGCCYVAGNNLHLCPYRKLSGEVVLRRPSQPRTLFVPGVGVMMDSVLSIYGRRTIGVLMTGIGDDGADQMVRIREAGGITIAESEESCVVFGMPYQAITRGGAEIVLPSWEIADRLVRILGAKTAGDSVQRMSEGASERTSSRTSAGTSARQGAGS
jgi:two-component system, chemotaxis family, protein-glutamate methylesterase/glutaminase